MTYCSSTLQVPRALILERERQSVGESDSIGIFIEKLFLFLLKKKLKISGTAALFLEISFQI